MNKNVLTINPEINIGTGDLELYLDVTIGGKAVVSKKADSLVANFLRLIYSYMSSENIPAGLTYHKSDGDVWLEETDAYGGITAITPGATTSVTHGFNAPAGSVGEYVQIYGTSGITPSINGFHLITGATSTSKTIAVSSSGSFVNEGARIRLWKRIEDSPQRSNSNTFGSFLIRVGRSSSANVTDQQTLLNEWDPSEGPGESFELDYGDTLVSTPAINYSAKTGNLSFTCQITNNSGATMDLGEVGLFAEIYDGSFDDRYSMIARDPITPVSLGTGDSMVVTYTIKTTQVSNGGFTDAFIKALAVQFNPALNQTFTDITGGSTSVGDNSGILLAISPSGIGKANTTLSGVTGDLIGLQVGTGNTAAAFNDTDLAARVEHGTGTGELIHYGSIVDNYDITGSVASFNITKLFENQSGATIGINEVGLVVAMSSSLGSLTVPTLLVRYVLPAQVDIPNGQILKFVLGIRLTVA